MILALLEPGKDPQPLQHAEDENLAGVIEETFRRVDIISHGACAVFCRDRHSDRILWWKTETEKRSFAKTTLAKFEQEQLPKDRKILRVYVEGRRHDYWIYFRSDDPVEILKSLEIAKVMTE